MKRGFRVALIVAVTAVAGRAATLLRSPYLQNVRGDAATLIWATAEPGAARVEYSASDQSNFRAAAAQSRWFPATPTGDSYYQHQAELTGLAAGREYVYRVRLNGEILKDATRFRTAAPGPFTFLAFGDSGTGGPAQSRLAALMMAREDPALVLHVGDLSQQEGTAAQLSATYFGVYAPLLGRVPFYPAPGNHEYYSDGAAPYLSALAPPTSGVPPADTGRYYSFDWGNAHFVSLDSSLLVNPTAADRMLNWLDRDLGRSTQYWRIVYFHHPPYPAGHHLDDPLSEVVRTRVVPILDRHNVHLVLSGHEHTYQRSLPLRAGVPVAPGAGAVYITTGGGGGDLHTFGASPLVAVAKLVHHYLRCQVRDSQLSVTAISIDGDEIDRMTLTPNPRIAKDSVVNAASFTPALAPGSLISIFGPNLAFDHRQALGLPLPTEMAGTSVSLNGQRLPLLFVSPVQINAQLPYGALGPATLRVTTPEAFAEAPVVLAEVAPAILPVFTGAGSAPAIVLSSSGALVSDDSPAGGGDYLTIYAVGLGELDRPVPAGAPAPGFSPAQTRNPVLVRVDDLSLVPSFAGLAPGWTGLYQVNVRLPPGLRDGRHGLALVVKGVSSETVPLPVGWPAPPPSEP